MIKHTPETLNQLQDIFFQFYTTKDFLYGEQRLESYLQNKNWRGLWEVQEHTFKESGWQLWIREKSPIWGIPRWQSSHCMNPIEAGFTPICRETRPPGHHFPRSQPSPINLSQAATPLTNICSTGDRRCIVWLFAFRRRQITWGKQPSFGLSIYGWCIRGPLSWVNAGAWLALQRFNSWPQRQIHNC